MRGRAKGRLLLIDMPKDRPSAAALLVDGRLEDLLLDPRNGDRTPVPGEIWMAKIDRVVPKIGGAFVKLGEGMAFLREAKGVRAGAQRRVQVVGHAEPGKAVPVTTRVLYKGRTVIHTPDAPGINVSRKIKDPDERARLQGIFEDQIAQLAAARGEDAGAGADWQGTPAVPPQGDARALAALETGAHLGGGFILRSAAEGAPAEELIAELHRVIEDRNHAEAPDRRLDRPLDRKMSMDAALREWTSPVPEAIVVHPDAFAVLAPLQDDGSVPARPCYRGLTSMALHARLRRHDGDDLFEDYGVSEEIERLNDPSAPLPAGGWIQIEPTAALVAVDVNTGGGFQGGDALTANLEAARELPRQLRLRGLGGQIAIDFAPLPKRDRPKIEQALKSAFRGDPIETTLGGWTPLGLFELSRKRERRPLLELL
ncbi:MAG: ribonuclease E/G [Pikeienuella sp.]